jgi:endonuclease/exonuclease/phosphatase family metal-dependent hydrolase
MKKILIYILLQVVFSNHIYIDLITTNDIHGVVNQQTAYFMNPEFPPNIVGGAAFYKYVNELKSSSSDNLLILDAGNFFQGSNFGMNDKGASMIEWMNMIGYDAVVPGQYDFIFGYENLNTIINQAKFPTLASNVICNECFDEIKPYLIKEINGVKIGILGIVNSDIPELVPNSKLGDISFSYEVESMKKWVPDMKRNGANIIIVLTSAGVPWDRDEVYDNFLNNKNPDKSLNAIEMGYYADGIDLIISGGISKGYKTAWYDPESHVYTIQNYGNGTSFGHIKLKIDEESKNFIGIDYVNNNEISHTLFSDDFEPDKNIKTWIENKISTIDYSKSFELDNTDNYIDIKSDNWSVPSFNTKEGIEIITWNCEFFPAANDSTINALSEIVKDIDSDIIAFQEIKKAGWFEKLMERLPEYNYVISLQASFMDLAIIYKKDIFEFISHTELFSDNDYNFAGRPPLKLELRDKKTNTEFSIINLHMKCCDSGLKRRKKASQMLYDYVSSSETHSNFIVLGDWNDDLKDAPNEHCFTPFLNDDSYYFVNDQIVWDLDQASYPKYPYYSFLDHILVNKSFISTESIINVMTIPIDDYMNGYEIYEAYISDHMPVLLSFNINLKK